MISLTISDIPRKCRILSIRMYAALYLNLSMKSSFLFILYSNRSKSIWNLCRLWIPLPRAGCFHLLLLQTNFLPFLCCLWISEAMVLVCGTLTPTGVPLSHSFTLSHPRVLKPCLPAYNCFLCLIESTVVSLVHFSFKNLQLRIPGLAACAKN